MLSFPPPCSWDVDSASDVARCCQKRSSLDASTGPCKSTASTADWSAAVEDAGVACFTEVASCKASSSAAAADGPPYDACCYEHTRMHAGWEHT
jgi:hypothetical protein